MLQFIKIGSACLLDKNRNINYEVLREKAREIYASPDQNVLVVSGAIELGMQSDGDQRNKADLTATELQGYASTGQIELMDLYRSVLRKNVAQLLVTAEDLMHTNHVRDLVHHNISKGRITLINYNDGVDFGELKKDNDTLAAQVMEYCNGDRLIILGSDYDGFIREGNLVERIDQVTDDMYHHCNGASKSGNGGFRTKLDAAKIVLNAGKEMIIGNIRHNIDDLIEGKVPRTYVKGR